MITLEQAPVLFATPEEYVALAKIGKNAAYENIRAERIASVRVSPRRIRIPLAALATALGAPIEEVRSALLLLRAAPRSGQGATREASGASSRA